MGERVRLGAIVIAIAASTVLVACKPHPGRAPRRDVSGMSVDQIERELARNREDLEAAGVWVPDATPAASPPAEELPDEEPPTAEPEPSTEVPVDPEAPVDKPAPDVDEAPAAPPEPARAAESISTGRSRRSRVDREARRESVTRCDRICDLADVTCDLQDQICALAGKHPHEVRYLAACERAELQCAAAERECDLCRE